MQTLTLSITPSQITLIQAALWFSNRSGGRCDNFDLLQEISAQTGLDNLSPEVIALFPKLEANYQAEQRDREI